MNKIKTIIRLWVARRTVKFLSKAMKDEPELAMLMSVSLFATLMDVNFYKRHKTVTVPKEFSISRLQNLMKKVGAP